MRSILHVNVLRCIGAIADQMARLGFSRPGVAFAAIPLLAAATVTFTAYAAPSKPVINDFQVVFDGIDQYWISGRVSGCTNLYNLPVTFMDSAYGHNTTTGPDGSFGYLLILSQPYNNTFSAKARSHDGVNSPIAVTYVY